MPGVGVVLRLFVVVRCGSSRQPGPDVRVHVAHASSIAEGGVISKRRMARWGRSWELRQELGDRSWQLGAREQEQGASGRFVFLRVWVWADVMILNRVGSRLDGCPVLRSWVVA